jgi:tol-pal system protein YbgF
MTDGASFLSFVCAEVSVMVRRGLVRRGMAGIGAAVIVAAALPAAAANREHQQLMADIRMLQEQNQQLQLALTSLNETLKALNARLDAQGEASRKAFADQRLVVETLGADVRIVREKIDDSAVRLSALAQEVDALRAMPPPSLAPVSTVPPPVDAAVAPAGAAPGAAPGASPPAAVNPAAGLSPQRLWEQAYADYASGQWSLAIAGFETYLKSFPRSDQADKAQRYVGESYLLDGKFEQAIAAYDKVIANYPNGTEVPLALYKRGLALVRLGQPDRARESWDTVIKNYPTSDAAVLAKQGLDRLARPAR